MKPNNLYYKQIAENTTGETYSKLYSSNYYAKKIAEHYNSEYTGRNPLNKYLEDWYTGSTGETKPDSVKPNVWYLRRLAKATDDSINEKILNENQCLHIIADSEPTPSTAILFEINADTFNSYNDSPLEYTGDLIIDWGDGNTETYTGGKLTHSYSSTDNYTIQIKGNITAILSDAFKNNRQIVKATLPNTITSIMVRAFTSNTKLTSVNIPKSVSTIDKPFAGDVALSEIVFEWSEDSEIVSYSNLGLGTLINLSLLSIPTGTTSLYEAKGYPSEQLQER